MSLKFTGMETSFIPNFQPLPFPAPLWLLQLLLVLGFFLHLVPMNLMVSSSVFSAVFLHLGRSDTSGYLYRIGRGLSTGLPIFTSFAITQGIVPLLFLQLLYGPAYYTSSILMAIPWLSVIALLIIAYYGCYIVLYRYLKKGVNSAVVPIILLAVSLLFAGIGFLFTNNMTLMLTPEKWAAMYNANPNGGSLNLSEPQLLPRYLHMMLGAVAVGSLGIGSYGLYFVKREPAYGEWLIKMSSRIFLGVTVANIVSGVWFLLSLPGAMVQNLMGKDLLGTIAFASSMVLVLLSLILISVASSSAKPLPFTAGMVSTLLLVLSMGLVRHCLRGYYLHPYFTPESVRINTQWDLLIPFLIGAVALIWYLTWLTKLVWSAYNKPNTVEVPNV